MIDTVPFQYAAADGVLRKQAAIAAHSHDYIVGAIGEIPAQCRQRGRAIVDRIERQVERPARGGAEVSLKLGCGRNCLARLEGRSDAACAVKRAIRKLEPQWHETLNAGCEGILVHRGSADVLNTVPAQEVKITRLVNEPGHLQSTDGFGSAPEATGASIGTRRRGAAEAGTAAAA